MIKVTVCIGSSCHLKGSREVVEQLQNLIKQNNCENDVQLGGAFCMGKCATDGVSVTVDDVFYSVKPQEVEHFFKEHVCSQLAAR